MGVRLDCSASENLLSHQNTMAVSEDIEPKSIEVRIFFVFLLYCVLRIVFVHRLFSKIFPFWDSDGSRGGDIYGGECKNH